MNGADNQNGSTEAQWSRGPHGWSHEEAEHEVGRILTASRVPFKKLCDPKRKKGDTETIVLRDVETGKTIEVKWKVYRSEREFDKLFCAYWRSKSTLTDEGERTKYGEKMLDSWKRDDVPRADFLALASGYFDFERGVKFITEENRLDRALPWFRHFLKSRFANEDMAERAMADYREKAFGSVEESYSLKDEFAKWKPLEKSLLTQESRKARGKRGAA